MDKTQARIGAFIFNLSKGGAQGVFVTVVNYLKQQGFEIEAITQNLDDSVYKDDLDEDIRIVNLQVASAKKLLPHLKNYIEQNSLDYAIAFSPEIAVNLYLARRWSKKNFVIYGRCINTLSYEYRYTKAFFRKYITNTLLKFFYHKIDFVIAQSNGMAEDLCKHYHFRWEQIKVIHNALGKKFEKELEKVDSPDQKENMILYSGRLEKQKGLEMLLDAFSQLKDRTVSLFLVGDGSEKAFLQQYAQKLGIGERTVFVGYTKNIEEYYRSAKLTVLSSYFEGFPNVLVESIACGTPVVAFDLPSGPGEIIIEGQNGYLVEYLNVEALAHAMDLALQTEWSMAEIKKTAQRFRSSIIMQRYLELFR